MKKIKNILLSVLLFSIFMILVFFFVKLIESKEISKKKSDAINLITNETFTIKNIIDRTLSSTFGLGILIKENNGRIDDFQRIANYITKIFPEIDSIVIAPGLIVSDVYPVKNRKKLIGLNLLVIEERKNDILKTIKTKKLLLGGPYDLYTGGGKGFIGRLPLFMDDKNEKFWGIITVTINLEHIVESTNLENLDNNGFYYKLYKLDPEKKADVVLISNSKKELIDPVKIKIDLRDTDDDWYLNISPKKGWIIKDNIILLYILGVIISILASGIFFVIISQPDFLKEKIKIVTEELNIKNKMLIQAEKLANFSKLTSAIAHEIRQPLNSIKILTDGAIFWEQENLKYSYEELLESFINISKYVDKIDGIIKNLKLMINSPDKIETKLLNINTLIQAIVDMFRQKVKNHHIDISIEPDNEIKEILLSGQQFQQVIINLLDNAINALDNCDKNDKMIRIKTEEKTDYIKISITDNGIGISEEIKDKIFEPFFSTEKTNESMGMGLYVVKNILKNFKSEIFVTNNEFNGATFEIILNR